MNLKRSTTRKCAQLAVIAAIVAAAAAGLAAVAPAALAATGDNRPATSSAAFVPRPTGGFEMFYRAFDASVYERTVTGGVFSGATALGGRITGSPAAAATGNSLVLAARGTDNAVWIKIRANGTWSSSWQSIGGRITAAPAVIETANGWIQVFVRGWNYGLWSKSRDPSGTWSTWQLVSDPSGQPVTAPAAVAAGDKIFMFVGDRGRNYQLRYRIFDSQGAPATDWAPLDGARTYVAASVAADPTGKTLTVAIRDTANQLVLNKGLINSTDPLPQWTGWSPLGGILTDTPAIAVAVAAAPSGFTRVLVRSTNDIIYTRYLVNGTWSSYTRAWTPAALPSISSTLRGVDWTRIQTTSKVVALTFDAGANADGLPSILLTLVNEGIPATFMLTGNFVRTFPAESNQVALSGFAIGNHSDTHPDFTTLSDSQVATQVNTARTAIRDTTGAETRPVFRFPSGARNTRVIADVNNLGYVPVRWTVDTLGWQGTSGGQSVQSVIDRVVSAAQPGEIVLMHVGSNPQDHTTLDADALPAIISRLRALGYTFTTVRALTG